MRGDPDGVPAHLTGPAGVGEPQDEPSATGRFIVADALYVMREKTEPVMFAHGDVRFERWGTEKGPGVVPGVAIYWRGRLVLLGTAEGACWVLHYDDAWGQVLVDARLGNVQPDALELPRIAQAASSPPDAPPRTQTPSEAPDAIQDSARAWTGGTQPGTVWPKSQAESLQEIADASAGVFRRRLGEGQGGGFNGD